MKCDKNMYKRIRSLCSMKLDIVIHLSIPVLVADHHSVTGDLTTLTTKFFNGGRLIIHTKLTSIVMLYFHTFL